MSSTYVNIIAISKRRRNTCTECGKGLDDDDDVDVDVDDDEEDYGDGGGDVEIYSVTKFDACLRCQAESSQGRSQDCVVVWGECNHSFHYCCMSLWVKQNNRCPLCQQEWSIQRMGK
ncbi:hypothetical protein RUM43_012481 [Polyplax serrata]|uniref:RING-type domain-containing protein n=1 Tax=Polyplax serrata TaxID=468196 RepID=A0AAN8RT03_POLSC